MSKLYVATDKNGESYLLDGFQKIGTFGDECVPNGNNHLCQEIDADLFPDLTFEDDTIELKFIEVK